MGESWVPINGYAIITHSFIAIDQSQITVITGDVLRVIEKTNDWYRGKNIYTKKDGIFPISCAHLYEGDDINPQSLLSKSEDILFLETAITIRYALNSMQKAPPKNVIQISNRIVDVISMYNLCKQQTDQNSVSTHVNLATNIDNLRCELGIPKNKRSFYSSMTTLSTWGRDIIENNSSSESQQSTQYQYNLLHASFKIKMIKDQMIFRFFLYNSSKNSYISCPISLLVSPEKQDYELVFDQLDKRDLSSKIWLCIYSYEIPVHREGQFDERKFVACASVEVPPCDNIDSYGKSITVEAQSTTSSNKSIFPIFHTILTQTEIPHSIEKTLVRCAPYFTIRLTPYFGKTESIVQGLNLTECQIIPPLLFPSTISPSEKRSMITINLSNLQLNLSHKKTRIIVRILDVEKKAFLPGFESIMMMLHNSLIWCSPIYSKDCKIHETFSFDLNVTQTSLSHLLMIIQIDKISFTDKKFVPCSYGIIPLASEIGSFTLKTESEIDLHPFSVKSQIIKPENFDIHPKSKSVGKIKYHLTLTSTKITQNKALYKLLNYKQFENEISENIKNFLFSGISEWYKYSSSLIFTLSNIIATIPNHSLEAFNALQSMFGEILSLASMDYSNTNELFLDQFDTKTKDPSNPFYLLSDSMLPLLINALNQNPYSQEYRNLIRTLPYLIQLISKSFSLNPKEEKRESIRNVFHILNEIIHNNGGEDKIQSTCILANQRLLFQNFSMLINSLTLCFSPQDALEIIEKFIESIRKDNVTIDKCKMELLLELSFNGIWNLSTSNKLQELFFKEIIEAFKKPHCIEYINRILTSILYSTNSNFIIKFLSSLEQIEADQELIILLISIAYYYPESISFNMFYKISCSRFLFPVQRLFILLYLINVNYENYIIKLNEMKKEKKLEFFHFIFRLALRCEKKYTLQLDEQLYQEIYITKFDFIILEKYYKSLPTNEQADFTLIPIIFRIYILFKNPTIFYIWYDILQADININYSPNKTLEETLYSFWKFSKSHRFKILLNAFDQIKTLQTLSKHTNNFNKIINSLMIIRKLNNSNSTQDEKGEAIVYVYEYAKSLNSVRLQLKMLKLLIELNDSCKNDLETANCLKLILTLIPCDNNKLKSKFLDFNAETNRELHIQILFRIVNLYIGKDFDELALNVLQQIIDTCIKPFQHIELMSKVKSLYSAVYAKMSKPFREYPMYFKCSFYGNSFSESYKNRSFIYRYNSSTMDRQVIFEMKQLFPNANVMKDTGEITNNENEMNIYVQSAFVSTSEEIFDKYYTPDYHLQISNAQFRENGSPTIFKCERRPKLKESEGKPQNELTNFIVQQNFYKTKSSFPNLLRRIEIEQTFPERELQPIEFHIANITKKNYKLNLEKYSLERLFDQFNRIPNNKSLINLNGTVMSEIQSMTSGTTYKLCIMFLCSKNLAENASMKKFLEKLKEKVLEQYKILEQCVMFLKEVESKEQAKNTENEFNQMKEAVKVWMDK